MDIYHVIQRPLVTEKSAHQSKRAHAATRSRPGRGGSYSFEVHPDANKSEIKQAVEKIYSVRVNSVRTSIRGGKRRRYRYNIGRTSDTKKAVVVLHPDCHIDLF
jgi:large subunit ribosomal protein L23